MSARSLLNILILTTVAFHLYPLEAKAGPLRVGAHLGVLSVPHPGLFGMGPSVRFLELIHIDAGIAPVDYVFAKALGQTDFIWGTTARVRLPILPIVPTVGVSYSRRHLNALDSDFYGNRQTVISYLNPLAGIEFPLGRTANATIGLQYTMRKQEGAWKKYDKSTSGNLGGTGLFPFLQLNYLLF